MHDLPADRRSLAGFAFAALIWPFRGGNIAIAVGLFMCPLILSLGMAADYWI